MLSTLEPRPSKKSQTFTQFTYDLPHRVQCSKYYPVSPQPSSTSKNAATPSIVVYGHDQGVTVVWKGFKVQQKAASEEPELNSRIPQPRGSRKRPSTQSQDLENTGRRRRLRRNVNSPEETEDIWQDILMSKGPTGSRQAKGPIPFSTAQTQNPQKETHTQTVHLGTAVHGLSFLPSTVLSSITPNISVENLVIISDDGSVPLSSRLLKNNIVMAIICSDNSVRLISLPLLPTPSATPQILTVSGISAHRTLPTAVSLALAPTPPKPDQARTGLSGAPSYEFLIASVSPDISGRLLLWRVALTTSQPRSHNDAPIRFVKPIAPHVVPLSHPAVHVSFNPSSSSSLSRHHLLIADNNGGLRVYDTDKRQWLLTLYMDFPPHGQMRKKILGAEWCLDGQAIVVLSGDGEWGIFELHGKGKILPCGKVGETVESSSNGKRRYGLGGNTIFSGSSTASSSTGGGTSIGNRSIRSAFSSSASNLLHVQPQITKGKLAVTILPSSRADLFVDIIPKGISGDHEMLALDYGNQLVVIPSIQETLAARKRGNGEKSRTVELKGIVLGGEDVASLDIRWLVAKRSPVATPTAPSLIAGSRPQSQTSELNVFGRPKSRRNVREDDEYDEEDPYYINDDGDIVHGKRPPPEAEKLMPKVQVIVGAGFRLNVFNVEDDVLNTSPASKALVMAKTGFVPGLAARVGGLGVSPLGYSSSPMVGGVFASSGLNKRKAMF
ncbi:hypothetical protein BGX38DRAFT_1143661 [Terfezia claveryi]|nr:hypothetical protein BGX38DRAFT_1143661 [Terfezia claveryi]